MTDPIDTDCDNGVCPECLDACLQWDEARCLTNAQGVYVYLAVRCPVCRYNHQWQEDPAASPPIPVVIPPYHE